VKILYQNSITVAEIHVYAKASFAMQTRALGAH